MSAIYVYRAVLDHLFALASKYRMFSSFERNCFLKEIKPPEWNLAMVLRSLTHLPYEPSKLSSDKHLTMLYFNSHFGQKSKGVAWPLVSGQTLNRTRTLSFVPEFVAKTQNPSLSDLRSCICRGSGCYHFLLLRTIEPPLTMFLLYLVWTWQSIRLTAGCSVALKRHVH